MKVGDVVTVRARVRAIIQDEAGTRYRVESAKDGGSFFFLEVSDSEVEDSFSGCEIPLRLSQ